MFTPIAKIVAAVLAFFYAIIPDYGVAIILLTILVMVIIAPLTIKSTRSMLAMQKLQPELKRLQTQHKNDRAALNEAVMGLYKEHGVSPLGGCLPMLLPFPVFFALFRTIDGLGHLVKGKSVPKYLKSDTRMYHDIVAAGGHLKAFGMDLAKSATSHHSSVGAALPYFALVLLMVGSQYYQQAQLTRRNPAAMQGPQAAMMKFLPIIFGLLFIRFPAGVLVYYTTSNLLRILMQWAMYRYDPKVRQLALRDVREVEAKTREIDEEDAKRPNRRSLPAAGESSSGSQPSAPPEKFSWRSLLTPPAEAAKPKPKPAPGSRPARPATKAASGSKPANPRAGTKSAPPSKSAPPTKSASGSKTASGSKSAPPAKSAPTAKSAPPAKGTNPRPAPVKGRPTGQPAVNRPAAKKVAGAGSSNGGSSNGTNGSNGRTPANRPVGADGNGAGTNGKAPTPAAAPDQTAGASPPPGPQMKKPTSSGAGRTGAARSRTPDPDPDANRNKRPRRGQ